MPPDPPRKDWLRRSTESLSGYLEIFPAISKVVDNPVVVLVKYCITCGCFPCFQKAGHVNHGTLKIYCGVSVSSAFLAVMWCSYYSQSMSRVT